MGFVESVAEALGVAREEVSTLLWMVDALEGVKGSCDMSGNEPSFSESSRARNSMDLTKTTWQFSAYLYMISINQAIQNRNPELSQVWSRPDVPPYHQIPFHPNPASTPLPSSHSGTS